MKTHRAKSRSQVKTRRRRVKEPKISFSIRLCKDLCHKTKIYCVTSKITVSAYVASLIQADLELRERSNQEKPFSEDFLP